MKDHHRQLLKYLTSRGLKPRVIATNRHIRISWKIGNRTYFITTAITPSDWRTIRNARADIRRQLSAAGFQWPVVLCRRKNGQRS
jgi:hypothetical protein